MRILRQGSHGPAVRRAQYLLHHNRFQDFKPGVIDGVMGRKTARACRRAKYWVGFKLVNCRGVWGPDIHHHLITKGSLTPAMKKRRARRLKLARLAHLRAYRPRAFKLAVGQLGYHETGNNINKFGAEYGMNGVPWCAQFASWAYTHAGRPLHYAYVPYIVDDAVHHRNGLAVTSNPVRGDLVCFDWDGGEADHVGFFDRWIDRSRGLFATVEGNTSTSNQSNGGQVMRRSRSTSQVEAFVRVNRVMS